MASFHVVGVARGDGQRAWCADLTPCSMPALARLVGLGCRPWFRIAICLAAVLLGWSNAAAAGELKRSSRANPFDASASDDSRRNALGAIPYDKLDPQQRNKVSQVLSNVSVFRRMPIRLVECDPELYLFLIQHPDVIVNIWEVLGVTQLQVRQGPDGRFRIADNAGVRGTLEMLYQSQNTQLAYAEGSYEGPLSIRPAKGRALILLRSGYVQENDGQWYITTRMDCFLNIDPGATELITKILQPMVGNVADNNFVQTVAFLGSLWRTAETNPRGVQRLATRLQNVQPELRQQLADMAERIGTSVQTAGDSPSTDPPVIVAEQASSTQRQ